MYERIKSKVSRSLWNGSIVQKTDGSMNPDSEATTRPTSLIVTETNQVPPNEDNSWSCENCTLDNDFNLEQCKACDAPRSPGQPCSGVVISVPAWEPRALASAEPLSYRRSFSDIDSVSSPSQRKTVNRRSLNDDEPPAVPPHSAGFHSSRSKYSYDGIIDIDADDTDVPPPLPRKQSSRSSACASQRQRHKSARSESTSPIAKDQSMWTCQECSYAYNPLWSSDCDICNSSKSHPSIAQPSLVTLDDSSEFN